jgi:hypothetical protein
MNASKYALALLASALCATAEPLSFDYTGREGEALVKAAAIARECPYGQANVHSVPTTGSMKPTLDSGCYVVTAKKPWAQLEVGDVILCLRPARGFVTERKVMHRIVAEFSGRKGRTFVLKGDACRADPGVFRERDYNSTVVAIVRFRSTEESK